VPGLGGTGRGGRRNLSILTADVCTLYKEMWDTGRLYMTGASVLAELVLLDEEHLHGQAL